MSRVAVAAFPSRVRGNPYCDLLYRGLRTAGVEVAPDAELSLGWLVRNRSRVKVLHLHWPEFYYRGRGGAVTARSVLAYVACLLGARALRYRLVWTVHNALPHERHPVDRLLRWVLVHAARVVVHGAAARAELPRAARGAEVIPHGHYIGVYPDTVEPEEARRRLRLPPDAPVFLCFGQVRAYKGVVDLVRVFAALPDPALRLVVAGRPATEADGRAVAAAAGADPRIRADLRHVADEDVQLYFKAADWVVLPYRDVLTSGTAVLALSFGRPVIAPRRGCLAELAAHRCGLAYSPDEPAALARALGEAIRTDTRPLRARALETARALDWDEIARAYARIFAAGA